MWCISAMLTVSHKIALLLAVNRAGMRLNKSSSTSCLLFWLSFMSKYHVVLMDSLPTCDARSIFPCETIESVVSEWDPRYGDLRKHANNLRFKADTAYIIFPKDTEEVVSTMRFAMARNLRPTVRSGGHCYEDFWSNNTGGILIDTTALNRIYRSTTDQSIIWVEAGVKMDQLYTTLYKQYGLTVPGGSCLDLGVGGFVAGAGYGSLARKFGLAIDFVQAIEIVHVTKDRDVRAVTVGRDSASSHETDLFWALRGGGTQNFGVITKFGFRNLPVSPPLVYKYELKLSLMKDLGKTRFLDFMDKFIRFFVENSGVDSKFRDLASGLTVGREGDFRYLTLIVMVLGEKWDLAEEFFGYLGLNGTDLMKVTRDGMSYFRFSQVTGTKNQIRTGGHYYVRRSAYMIGPMPLHQRETIWHFMTDPSFSSVVDGSLEIRSYGCEVARQPENATSYPHRRAVVKLQYSTVWHKVQDAPEQWEWSRQFYRAMYGEQGPRPDDMMDGCFLGYPDADLVDWQHLYFKNNYEKLREVKKEWDPLNVFRHRQSIELPDE